MTTDSVGAMVVFDGSCTCSRAGSCDHPAALAFAALVSMDIAAEPSIPRPRQAPEPQPAARTAKRRKAAWETGLSALVKAVAAPPAPAESGVGARVALQFDIEQPPAGGRGETRIACSTRGGTRPPMRRPSTGPTASVRPAASWRTGWSPGTPSRRR
ncbi:hypothetical protein GCM10012279_28170 [Micromonospora yangpuensis]|nr:hypothetical protein GCM10012279_28170 [Micromonospora yangpuensis]